MTRTLFIFSFTFFFFLCKGQNEQPTWAYYNLNGDVKEIREYSFYYNKKTKILLDSTLYKFNSEGRLLQSTVYNCFDSTRTSTVYTYDNRPFLLSVIIQQLGFSTKDQSRSQSEFRYVYDSKSRMSEMLEFDSLTHNNKPAVNFFYNLPSAMKWREGAFPTAESSAPANYICDSNARITGGYFYMLPEKKRYYQTISRNGKGRATEVITRYIIDSVGFYRLQKAVQAVRLKKIQSDKNIFNSSKTYTYDSSGNMLSETDISRDGKLMDSVTYSYTLDDQKNWILRTINTDKKSLKGKEMKTYKKFNQFQSRTITYF